MREGELQKDVLKYLRFHPNVAWARINTTGIVKTKQGGWVRIGIPGESDIIGQLTNGKILAIEIKLPGCVPSLKQLDFLELVQKNNGVSGWVTSINEIKEILDRSENTNGV